MASLLVIKLRQAEATRRILAAAPKVAKRLGIDLPNLTPMHKDPGLATAMQLEAFAEFLEAAGNVSPPPLPPESKAPHGYGGEPVAMDDVEPEVARRKPGRPKKDASE